MLWHPTYLNFLLEGMPEMLKPTSLIMGAGLGQDVACLTDGRFSGGYVTYLLFVIVLISDPSFLYLFFSYHTRRKLKKSCNSSHGFCIGHVVPEAQAGGPIALVQDGDIIAVDAIKNMIELRVSPEELEKRRAAWVAPPLKVSQGTLYKYIKVVTDASHGCVTDA
jgi:dihydroxy-acid dehydratase